MRTKTSFYCKLLLFALASFLIIFGNRHSFGYEWSKTFGGNENDYGWSVQQTTDGGYIIAGNTNSDAFGHNDVYLIYHKPLEYAEIIGTWTSGIWYWDVAKSKWTKMWHNKPSGAITAGYFTGDTKADVASTWDFGLWYQNGASRGWTQVSLAAPDRITAGDITSDGRDEIIGCGGAWSLGIWVYDIAKSSRSQINDNTPIGAITAGDFNGDGKADVSACWKAGLYWQDVAAGR